jgi:hypothetical protein
MVVAYTPTKGAAMIFRGKILAIVAPIDEGSGREEGVAEAEAAGVGRGQEENQCGDSNDGQATTFERGAAADESVTIEVWKVGIPAIAV